MSSALKIEGISRCGSAFLENRELEQVEIDGAVMTHTYRESYITTYDDPGKPHGTLDQFLIVRRLVT